MKLRGKIVIYPFDSANPYQTLLSSALTKLGQIVELKQMVNNTLPFHLLRSSSGAKILHLHWIAGLYEGKTKPRFIVRTILFLLTLLILRSKGVRVALTLHNLVPHDAKNKRFHIFARRLILFFCNFVIVHSEPAREEAAKYFGQYKKMAVVPHGHYQGYYPNGVSKGEARNVLNIPENAKLILFLGGLRPYKGIEFFIQLFRDLESENLFFLTAGRGEENYVKSLKRGLPKNCLIYSSYVGEEEVQYYMNASDCMVLPYTEGLTSGAAVLALSFYLPIIATHTVAVRHLVEEKLALCFEPGNIESLRTSLKELLSWDAAAFRERCGNFLRSCSWERVAERHLDIFGLLQKRI
jgi:glycosyltransferase involved in cell wall biosynthesis